MNKFTGSALMAVALLALVGCGNSNDTAAPSSASTSATSVATPVPTTTTPAGPVAFVEWAKTADLGTKDPALAGDDQLLSIGNSGCDLMSSAPSFGWAVEQMVKELKETQVTAGEMDGWLRQSVINLCPQHKVLLP